MPLTACWMVNHTANGLNGPKFIFFHMMAIANNCLLYNISIYSFLHPPSLTPKPTAIESRPLRFPQIPPFSAPATLLHLPVSHLHRLRKPVTFSVKRVEESRAAGPNASGTLLVSPFLRLPHDSRFLLSLPTTPSGCHFPKRSHHRRWLEFVF